MPLITHAWNFVCLQRCSRAFGSDVRNDPLLIVTATCIISITVTTMARLCYAMCQNICAQKFDYMPELKDTESEGLKGACRGTAGQDRG